MGVAYSQPVQGIVRTSVRRTGQQFALPRDLAEQAARPSSYPALRRFSSHPTVPREFAVRGLALAPVRVSDV
jgi:hypothetical protein